MKLGEELRAFRTAVGMKQDVAASHLGVSQAYISRLESGSAKPSRPLAERIRKLMETPRHRPHFEHWVATVLHSPHHVMLCSLQDRDVRVEAISPAVTEAGPPFDSFRPGHLVAGDLGHAANEEVERLIALGAFSGDVAAVDGVWYSQTHEKLRFWRTINVPVRDQIGNWFLHSTTLELDEAVYRSRLERDGDSLLVSRFGEDTPVPARQIVSGAPAAPPETTRSA